MDNKGLERKSAKQTAGYQDETVVRARENTQVCGRQRRVLVNGALGGGSCAAQELFNASLAEMVAAGVDLHGNQQCGVTKAAFVVI